MRYIECMVPYNTYSYIRNKLHTVSVLYDLIMSGYIRL